MTDISSQMFTVYTASSIRCPHCERVKAKLTELGHPFDERDIVQPAIREELRTRRPTAKTVPQIFLADEYIGGCDDLFRLINANVLDAMIEGHAPTTTEVTTPLG